MGARNCRITLEDYCRTKGIPSLAAHDLKVEGTFHPRQDLRFSLQEDKLRHFEIENLPRWGVTYSHLPPLQVIQEGLLDGYYHLHGEEKVYLKPIGKPGAEKDSTLIPCYECNVAIEADWNKYSR